MGVLTPDYRDFLWLNSLIATSDDVPMNAVWCADTASCVRLIKGGQYDVLLWDCQLHDGDEISWLQYLAQAGGGHGC